MFDWKNTHKNQVVDVWLVREQKSVEVIRKVYQTSSGDTFAKYQGCYIGVRGQAGGLWHGNYG